MQSAIELHKRAVACASDPVQTVVGHDDADLVGGAIPEAYANLYRAIPRRASHAFAATS